MKNPGPRKRYGRLICLVGWCLGSITGISAQTEPGNVYAITEQEAIERALSLSKNLEFVRTDVEIAKHELNSAGAFENPELRCRNISEERLENEFDEVEVGLRISLPGFGERTEKKQEARVIVLSKSQKMHRNRIKLVSRGQAVLRQCHHAG